MVGVTGRECCSSEPCKAEVTGREYCLSEAGKAVLADRNKAYGGKPENNFERVAALWTAYKGDTCFTVHDVAAMMGLLKIARISSGAFKVDNWVDLAGYAACGLEAQASECDTEYKFFVGNESEDGDAYGD